MDPMDFTMDDSSNVLAASAHRYQCQQPQAQPHSQTNAANFASQGPSQARDSQQYDPVHESSTWYHHHHHHHNNSNATSRPPYPAPGNLSPWASPHTDQPHNWSPFAEMDRSGRSQDYNSPDYRRPFIPWNESRGFDAFGHSAYIPPPVSGASNMSSDAALQARTTSLRGYGMDQQQPYLFSRDVPRATAIPQYNPMPSSTASSEPRPPQASGAASVSVETSAFQQPPSFTDLRPGMPRARSNISRHEDILEGSRRRRLATAWDSDDDEESAASYERMEVARRHAAETLFGAYDDERSVAAIRSAVAAAKRVPSKEALDSLEPVKVADLKDADRTCIICYNEFGVSNPEGEIENPIRLPKCKHVFGDKCIKKWFEDSDSCPYCRDKLPSESAARKSLGAYQSYRLAHREQMRLAAMAAQRQRYSSYASTDVPSVPGDSDSSSSATAQRAQADIEFMMARQAEYYYPSNRNANGDSPERRRQARGRHSGIRAPHYPGRPTSVGSARPSNPSFTHQPPRNFADYYAPQRRNVASETSMRETRDTRDREARTAAEARLASAVSPFRASWGQPSSEVSGSAGRTPAPRLATDASAPTEATSPPVAVGSGVSVRRQIDQSGSAAARLSLDSDSSDFMFEPSGESRNRQSLDQANNGENRGQGQNESSPGIPSFGALLEVSNNSATRFGSDASNDADDLARIGRMDAGIPPGWGAIN
ncbi:uncharacterized protein LY89DRAFT_11372 [Mollisia scopiformis]|uniref:RING-type domain-containing protein n=1 Tax=Mollisia scopiformis TaxID=149040 RepID=A0A194XVP8_MOLSC|nr:uncharacterized protein LY89DRAFT_11372 [Mollisia scopiformis]KUJ24079.1 hypothetical protein LY89DRAFT_11372 [Mollisia scopiformis]